MKKSSYIIGVDPGKSPAICVLRGCGELEGTYTVQDNGDFNFEEYALLVQRIHVKTINEDCDLWGVCERPHSVYGASAKSNMTFGTSIGACLQQLYNTCAKVFELKPKEWQKKIIKDEDIVKVGGKKDTKATSLQAAKRLRGGLWDEGDFLRTKRSRVVDHNLIDAYLIGMSIIKDN